MIKRFYILLLAIVASVGMSFAQAGVVSSGTKGGMSYTFYDNGLLEISGNGALPGSAFTNWDGGFGTSVKNIRFAEDCEVYGLDYLWFGCYTENSQLETVEINSVAPILFSGTSGAGIFYRQDGAVTITITAPAIVDVESGIIGNYGSPVNMIFNLPATTVFEKKWFSGLENNFAVTIPTGAKGHVPGGYSFTNPYDQQDYDDMVAHDMEDLFWESHSHLEEGVDYTLGEESTFVITAENASQIFGQATVSFQAPTEARNSEWVLWQKSDLKTFSDMSSGDQKVYKDVTVKVNNGVYNTDSGWGIHFESSGEDGVQFVAPEGKVFKRIVILNGYGTFSDSNWSYDSNYKRWSGSANTVGFVGNICGISLIEFEVDGSAPAAPANSCGDGVIWELNDGEMTISYTGTGTGAMENYSYYTKTPWYDSRKSITSIIIQDGVTTVGNYSFMDLENLQSVVIGNDVVTIGSHAFEQCGTSFTSLTLGNSIVEIGEQAFINNSRITSINLPNTLQTIGEDAFYGCTKISSLTIPSSVTSIGDYAFGGCSLIAYIIAQPTTPPSTEENTFISIVTPSYIPLYVPNGSVAAYTAADRWNTFNIQGYDPSTGPTIEPVPATPDQLSGAFTINGDGDQINFSKGNLQYVGSWRFAENQWNIIGNDQADNNRDLFGWGTGDAPNKVSTTLADYAVYHEWGTNMGDGWYTLSRDEWTYLFQSRTNAANLYAPARVNGVSGFVILPDEFTLPSGLSFTAGVTNYGTNFYANAAWRAMENAGAVFLPVDGYRYDGNKIKWVGQDGFYWSSTVASEGASAWSWLISASNGARRDYYNLHYGMCVRLVKAVVLTPDDVMALINAIGTVEYTAESKKKIDAARKAYDGLSEADKALVTNYSTLQQAEAAYQAFIQAEADKVIAKIAALPNPVTAETAKLSVYNKVVDARTAYDALKAEEKALVTNLAILEAAEAFFDALPGGIPEGALKGAFTINAGGDRILFSKGNLQYVGSWQFAAHQWDIIGAGQADDNRDLFGWGTGDAPNKVSETSADYTTYTEWGTQMGAGWYTLDYDEWKYIFKTRANAANLYAPANVNGVNGIVLLPDEWKQPDGTTFTSGVQNFSTNVYADEAWTAMENAGAVFLPVAGYRYKGNINWVGQSGFYWTSTVASAGSLSWSWLISASSVSRDYYNLYYGMSVRLVNAAGAGPIDAAQAAVDLINAIPNPVTLDEACVKAIKDAREAVTALGANASLIDETDMAKLTKAEADYTNLIKAEADKVVAKINAIPQPVTLKLATRDSIESARAAYDALTADQKALVTNYAILEAAEAALAALNPGGGAPAGALNGKFTINAGGDQIAFSKGNLQATTTDLGAHWTWGFAANQWNYLGIAVANSKINGNGTVSENGTVDLFGWSTNATYYGINNSYKAVDYIGDFVDWGPNMGAGWRTLTKDEWAYLLQHSSNGKATVNDKNGYIFLPDNWSGPAFTPNPDNFTTNVYSGDDWTAMENAGAVFLPSGPARNGTYALIANDAKYCSSTSLNNDSSYVFTIYYNQSQSACTGTNRAYGCMVRLVSEGGGATPLDSAQAVKDLIEAIPTPVTLEDACVKAIEDARAAYDALSEATKGALDDATVQKLTDAEAALTALNQAEADKVIAKINNIPLPVELKLATRDSIQNARAAYDALNAAQQALVTNYTKLTDAEDALAALNPGVPPATPLDSAQHVKDLIDAIPTPVEYPTSGPAIAAALVAYQQLSDAAKGALEDADVQKMTDAAIQYAALDAIAAIEAIPAEIVYDPAVKAAIETAREKYDALIDASKALVDAEVVAKLTNAEQAWADLVALIEHNVSYIGKDGELKNEKVALLNIPNPAPDFNGHEFVRWDVKAGDFLEEGLRIKAVYTPIITTQPVAYDTLMYNGTAQTLIEAGVASDGHIEYSLYPEEPESWSANLPTATNAGVYAVSYKLVREGHEDYMAGSVTAVIAKAPVTYVAPQAYDTLAYNYNTQVLVTAGQTNDGTIEYSLDPNLLDSWSADLPQAMNAGTYDVYFRVQGDLNHFDSIAPAPVAVTIAKRDIEVTAPVAYDTLVYNALAQTLAAAGSADFGTMEYTLTPDNNEGWSADMPQAVDAGTYAVYYRVQGDTNHNDFAASIAATVAKAPLTIMAEDKEVEYGESAPEFTVTFNGWQGQDDASVVSDLKISSDYAAGSSVGTYAIVPGEATALNYAMSYVNGTLTVNKAKVSVINAEAQKAKFADGHAVAVVLNQGTLDGVKLNDAVTHVTTAAFSSAEVAENLTITLFYELQGDEALLANYLLEPTSKIFSEEGVIIEPFLPNNTDDPEDKESKVQEGIEVYAYGYCEGDSVGLKYHLNSGNPNQYMIEYEDSLLFKNVGWTDLEITGPEGVIYIDVPVNTPTGDYKMTVYFRDSSFVWLPSQPLNVTFHVNLPETYVRPLFDNTIALVDTCNCFTDIQWYHRADASEQWQPISGANGHYLHVEGKLTGEYFVKAKMNGVETYTCEQTDMQTLYGAETNKQAKVKAYPNPVVSTTTVSIENSENYEHSLRIVNLMGIEVKNTTFEGNETVVDMDSYTTGNYTISVDGIVVKVLKK